MGILIDFLRDIREWDTPSKWAFGIALSLLVIVGAILTVGSDKTGTPALIGFIGLVIATQVIVLWGNRNLVTPYTKAQRAFMAGDFESAKSILSQFISNNKRQNKTTHADVYVLLGNSLRNLGDIDVSLTVLRQAVTSQPDYHFALYGLGRTLMVAGDYHESLTTIKKSLFLGAPSVVKFDLGYAHYLDGTVDEAYAILDEVLPTLTEPHRQLMARQLLARAGLASPPPTEMIERGLPFWENEADRFSQTRYGQAVAQEIITFQTLLGG